MWGGVGGRLCMMMPTWWPNLFSKRNNSIIVFTITIMTMLPTLEYRVAPVFKHKKQQHRHLHHHNYVNVANQEYIRFLCLCTGFQKNNITAITVIIFTITILMAISYYFCCCHLPPPTSELLPPSILEPMWFPGRGRSLTQQQEQ